jgi:hypothetical protein
MCLPLSARPGPTRDRRGSGAGKEEGAQATAGPSVTGCGGECRRGQAVNVRRGHAHGIGLPLLSADRPEPARED